ncbi:response regulator [Solibacillus isronensis]|uniref:response regulator n=1 Tax=Solibacillus isronensis TaxID=412383 RepID=UPI0039A32DFE
MYKIIVVEDDRIIRRGICQTIPWGENGIEVVGEASDGEMALELIAQQQPHLVISDINMPFLNGLDMARQLKEISPQTKFIFLTGYEDFSYAQQAVQLKAFDYLLKPVDSELLLEKVKEALAEWSETYSNEQLLVESRAIRQQKFFKQLMADGDTETDIEKGLSDLDVHLDGKCYSAIVVHDGSEGQLLDEQIVQLALTKLDIEKFHLVSVEDNEWVLLIGHDEAGEAVDLATFLLEQLPDVTLAYGRPYTNLFEIGRSFIEAKMALDLRYIMGTGKLFSIDDKVTNGEQTAENLRAIDVKLIAQIKQGVPEKVEELLEEFHDAIIDYQSLSLGDLKVMTLKYATLLSFEIDRWSKDETSTHSADVYRAVMEMNSLHDMIQIIRVLIKQWSEILYQKEESKFKSHVDLAIYYMKEYYSDSTLTLQKLAKMIHVSAPYLSNLFKLEKGFNFGDYLLELRMKKAMELLREESLKTYEISEQVGYSNPQYFSICFKKYTGHTPAEFKKKLNPNVS